MTVGPTLIKNFDVYTIAREYLFYLEVEAGLLGDQNALHGDLEVLWHHGNWQGRWQGCQGDVFFFIYGSLSVFLSFRPFTFFSPTHWHSGLRGSAPSHWPARGIGFERLETILPSLPRSRDRRINSTGEYHL